MNTLDNIIAYENGEMDYDQVIEFFQGIINSGVVWHLQGSYGNTAQCLIETNVCLTASEYAAGQQVAEEAQHV